MQAVFVPHGGEYAWNAEEFSQTLDAMERLDDWAATALKPQFKRWMEQNGFIPKQPLYQFHQELEDEELTYYGWEFDTEGYAEDDELEQIIKSDGVKQTCHNFERFKGENLVTVSRDNLILSVFRKLQKNN